MDDISKQVMWKNRQAYTLGSMASYSKLCVIERVAQEELNPDKIWQATAQQGSTMRHLAEQWMQRKLPRSKETLGRALKAACLECNVILIIHHAHLLSPRMLSCMHPLSEYCQSIILQGNIFKLGCKVQDNASFMARAHFFV